MYSAKLLDHFEHPRHAGELAAPDNVVRVENPVCGDVLELQVRVENGRVAEVGFRARSCVPAMACASAVAEWLMGRPVEEARQIRHDDVIALVDGVPPASGHAADLAVDAVRAVLRLEQN